MDLSECGLPVCQGLRNLSRKRNCDTPKAAKGWRGVVVVATAARAGGIVEFELPPCSRGRLRDRLNRRKNPPDGIEGPEGCNRFVIVLRANNGAKWGTMKNFHKIAQRKLSVLLPLY